MKAIIYKIFTAKPRDLGWICLIYLVYWMWNSKVCLAFLPLFASIHPLAIPLIL